MAPLEGHLLKNTHNPTPAKWK